MWSASSLKYRCAYPNVLDRGRTPSPAQQESMDRGTAFHKAVEDWLRTGIYPELEDMELQGWVDGFASQWTPPSWAKLEIAWGLGEDGQHLMVEEPEPHRYVARGGMKLLTAGRADLVYWDQGLPGGCLMIVDYKTGKSAVEPPATNLQVNAAGLALMDRFGAAGYVPGIYAARDAAFEWGDPVAKGSYVAEEMLEAVRMSALLPETPIVGDHCGSCWDLRLSRCKEGMAWAGKR